MVRVACACGQTKGNAAEAVGEGAPARPAAPDKAAQGERRYPRPADDPTQLGPPHTHVRPPCGGRTPAPTAPYPAIRASTAPGHRGAGARALARLPTRRCPHALVAPAGSRPARASPLPAGQSARRKQRSRRRSARPPAGASLTAYPSPAAGPCSPSLLAESARRPPAAPRRQARRSRDLGCAAGPPGAALTAAAPGRRGAVGELG